MSDPRADVLYYELTVCSDSDIRDINRAARWRRCSVCVKSVGDVALVLISIEAGWQAYCSR